MLLGDLSNLDGKHESFVTKERKNSLLSTFQTDYRKRLFARAILAFGFRAHV